MSTSTVRPVRPGLTSTEAARRLRDDGLNRVAVRRPVPVHRRVLGQLRDPMMLVLLAAAALTVLTGDHPDALIIAFVVVVNTAVGVAQELRAENAVAALAELTAPTARARRDGAARTVPAEELVVGDLVELAEGDVVPADGTLLESAGLLVDESALTGESVPVDKRAEYLTGPDDAPERSLPGVATRAPRLELTAQGDEEARSRVSAGTVVLRGRALAEVTATGPRSAMGRIAGLLTGGPSLTPLQRRLAGLGRTIAAVAGVLCVLVAVLGLLRGQPLELMAVTAISLVVAAVPESLPAVVTLSLALGARRMAARNAIVRRLAAVETLGAVTVIGTDKTGTLTEGRMVVEWLWTPAGEAAVTGTGYSPEGAVVTDAGPVTADEAPHLTALLDAARLCNDATLEPGPDGGWTAVGDPTEAALLAAAARLGLPAARSERVDEVPFDSLRRRMTTLHRDAAGWLLVCKGAPESLLRAEVLAEPAPLLAAAAERAAAFADDGYRVLAVATGRPDDRPAALVAAETGLRLLGLVAIADPPRPAAAATIAACRAAGITPVLITGDHVATARSIAVRLGIIAPGDPVATGRRPEPDLTRARVFARTAPEQKLDVVQAWRDAGQVVAMTGDGVNDGPALRRCDIGVAMGRRGTEVARQAADLVLADDDLATVVAAVEEGRRVHDNVRRFLLYGLAGGTAEIAVMLAGPLLGLALPLLPAQILWVNLLTHGLPGVALGAEPAEPGVMRRPPRPPAESVLGAGLWQRIAQLGLVLSAVSLGVGVWGRQTGRPWQSMLFLALCASQLGVALGVRARPGTRQNPFLLLAVVAAFGLQLLALYLPVLRDLLGTEPLTAAQLAAVGALSAVGYLAARLVTARSRRPGVTRGRGPRGRAGRSSPAPGRPGRSGPGSAAGASGSSAA